MNTTQFKSWAIASWVLLLVLLPRLFAQSSESPGAVAQRDLRDVLNGHERQELDLCLPNDGTNLPLSINIDGGAFKMGNKEDNVPLAYLARGYAVASINDGLSQRATFPAQTEDGKAAVRGPFSSLALYEVTHEQTAEPIQHPLISPVSQSKPFTDSVHKSGPPNIPGIVQCALYDLGGEGVAYHDSDTINNGSGKLNLEPGHQRAHASPYIWQFRKDEGVDISFVKDWADLNHTNLVSPPVNQLYIGWTENGEWCRYTVNVSRAGIYRVKCLYTYKANSVQFDVNGQPAGTCRLPIATASFHHWNFAEIGTVQFPTAGLNVLTFHYGKGNNFAYFEFEPLEQNSTSTRLEK